MSKTALACALGLAMTVGAWLAAPAVAAHAGTTSESGHPGGRTASGAASPPAAVPAPAVSGSRRAMIPARTVNLSGVASWAHAHATRPFLNNDGYGDDCTDFASRALQIGGRDAMTIIDYPFQNRADNHNWYFLGSLHNASFSWGGAYNLADHLFLIGSTFVTHWNQARPGDIIFANWRGGPFSGISHTGVVIGMSRGVPIIAQHTRDVVESLNAWIHANPHAKIWIAVPNRG
jgi:Putative amidase domain